MNAAQHGAVSRERALQKFPLELYSRAELSRRRICADPAHRMETVREDDKRCGQKGLARPLRVALTSECRDAVACVASRYPSDVDMCAGTIKAFAVLARPTAFAPMMRVHGTACDKFPRREHCPRVGSETHLEHARADATGVRWLLRPSSPTTRVKLAPTRASRLNVFGRHHHECYVRAASSASGANGAKLTWHRPGNDDSPRSGSKPASTSCLENPRENRWIVDTCEDDQW